MIYRFSISFLVLLFTLASSACESIFFYPSRNLYLQPSSLGLEHVSHTIPVNDKENIFLWELKPKAKERGSILFLHGNAENISTHINAVSWLPDHGYRVFLLDYRGFGASDGVPSVTSSIEDIEVTIEWLRDKRKPLSPLILFSQSIGASLALHALSKDELRSVFSGFVFDSPFSSYRKIAREKIQETIFLYPFAWPLSFLFTDCCSPLSGANKFTIESVRVLHVEDDSVVELHHSNSIFNALRTKNKEFWTESTGGHISFLKADSNKLKILDFFTEVSSREEAH